MSKTENDIMGKSRSGLMKAQLLMDEEKFKESSDNCIESSVLALQAVLLSWNLPAGGPGCWEKLKIIGQHSPGGISSELRSYCKKMDRFSAFYRGVDEARAEMVFDEESTMEIINYGREILRFAQRSLRREDAEAPAED